jgi:hypothetical protein
MKKSVNEIIARLVELRKGPHYGQFYAVAEFFGSPPALWTLKYLVLFGVSPSGQESHL